MSPEARTAWVTWYNAWSRVQASAEGALAAAFSKLEEIPARLSLIHHIVSRLSRGESDLRPVGVESVHAGITLAKWFSQESERVYALLAETESQRDLRQLVDLLRRHGGVVTARDLQRANGPKYPTAEVAEEALQALEEAGLGVWMDPPAGKQSRVFRLARQPDNPTNATAVGGEDLAPEPDAAHPTTRASPPVLQGI